MCDHTESVYKNNCIKVVKNKPETISYLEKQVQNMRLSSTSAKASTEKDKIKSFLEFYDSIPEYDDVNHLSNKEFYKKLDYLRQRQRTFYESLISESNSDHTWYDNYKNHNSNRNSIIKVKCENVITPKPPSRRSVRIESPEIIEDTLYKTEKRPKSCRVYSGSSMESTSRHKTSRNLNKSPFCDSTLDDLSDCTLTTRSVPCSPRKQINITPDTFKMTVRDEEDKIIHSDEVVVKKHKSGLLNDGMFRANPVPIESRIPLFDKIMHEQEIRRSKVKQKSKDTLRAQMNLFSFTKREEEISDLTKRLSKSTPDLFLSLENPRKSKQFKAKPVPKNLFSNYVYQKMHEDEYYRRLQKKIRAEEMLKTASLPPSMEKREKSKPKYQICPKSFREMYENQMRKIPPGRRKDLEKELAELELDFIMATPSPVNKPKSSNKKRKNPRKTSSSSSGKSSRTSATLESINRSNLAAVLRIQTSRLFDRKRMEDEICRRLEEAQFKEEARWREKVLRKRPVWQSLAYSHEEDLNMRLQVRRDEERMRSEAHRAQMEVMLGRVNQQPTLFERQSNGKLATTREDLITIAELYGEKYPKVVDLQESLEEVNVSRNGSGDSRRKCVEMKDEGIQAKFDDVLSEKDDYTASYDEK